MQKIELLAPAGDLERLKVAIDYGADAVYLGGPILGLRANAKNFTYEEIKEGCIYAHERNKKVYVTVNIVLHNKEANLVEESLKQLEKCGVDAIIVSDPAVISIAKKNTNLEIHLSTQQSTLNIEACRFWKKQGVSRIVLGREVSKEGILEIRKNVDIEIECFVHGAMCAGLSGRCVLSNYLTNRDANRGGCSQICRWDFDLRDKDLNLIKGENNFTFCSKDLSMLTVLPDMIKCGISSLKIEGRMRSIYYVATIVNIYRKAIDEYYENECIKNIEEKIKIVRRCANRDSIVQFFNGVNDYTCGYYNGRFEESNQDFLGVVLEYNDKTKVAVIEQRNYFKKGDIVDIFGPKHDTYTIKIDDIFDENNNIIDVVRHPRQVISMVIDKDIKSGDIIRIHI